MRECYKNEAIEMPKGSHVTIMHDDIVLGIFGGYYITKGCLQAWAILSEDITKYPIAFHKAVLKLINNSLYKLDNHRIQFSVKSDYDKGIKWALSLGFNIEGIMQKYGPDKSDYVLMARVS